MGRPIKKNKFLGTLANNVPTPHQIQATVFGANDTGSTAGYLTSQNSPHRFRATTVNGTSLTTLVNGSGNLVQGTSFVKVFPVGSYPTITATGTATLKVVGAPNVVIGGSGYTVGNYLTLVGGTNTASANVQVTGVNANGAITSLSAPINGGSGVQAYTVLPSNIAGIPTTDTTGPGVGAVISANFGVDTATVTAGGAGYSTAVFTVGGETVAPVFVQPTVVGGVVTTGTVTVSSPGIVNVNPVVVIEEQTAPTEYVRTITSGHYLNTYQGNQYRWIPKDGKIPSNYANANVKLCYLDTL